MSLRDKNRNLPATTGAAASSPGSLGSLRTAATAIAKPSGRGMQAIQNIVARQPITPMSSIGFVIDATASRSDTWAAAQEIQADMFGLVRAMRLRLVHFGGGELTVHPWENDNQVVAGKMAEVACRAGSTQIIDGLSAFLADDKTDQAKSIILVGDSFEENIDDLLSTATDLAKKNIKVFSFFESSNCDEENYAENAFRQLAERTGGVFARFGDKTLLAGLCEGVALMTSGGQTALSRLNNAAARKLLLSAPKL